MDPPCLESLLQHSERGQRTAVQLLGTGTIIHCDCSSAPMQDVPWDTQSSALQQGAWGTCKHRLTAFWPLWEQISSIWKPPSTWGFATHLWCQRTPQLLQDLLPLELFQMICEREEYFSVQCSEHALKFLLASPMFARRETVTQAVPISIRLCWTIWPESWPIPCPGNQLAL